MALQHPTTADLAFQAALAHREREAPPHGLHQSRANAMRDAGFQYEAKADLWIAAGEGGRTWLTGREVRESTAAVLKLLRGQDPDPDEPDEDSEDEEDDESDDDALADAEDALEAAGFEKDEAAERWVLRAPQRHLFRAIIAMDVIRRDPTRVPEWLRAHGLLSGDPAPPKPPPAPWTPQDATKALRAAGFRPFMDEWILQSKAPCRPGEVPGVLAVVPAGWVEAEPWRVMGVVDSCRKVLALPAEAPKPDAPPAPTPHDATNAAMNALEAAGFRPLIARQCWARKSVDGDLELRADFAEIVSRPAAVLDAIRIWRTGGVLPPEPAPKPPLGTYANDYLPPADRDEWHRWSEPAWAELRKQVAALPPPQVTFHRPPDPGQGKWMKPPSDTVAASVEFLKALQRDSAALLGSTGIPPAVLKDSECHAQILGQHECCCFQCQRWRETFIGGAFAMDRAGHHECPPPPPSKPRPPRPAHGLRVPGPMGRLAWEDRSW